MPAPILIKRWRGVNLSLHPRDIEDDQLAFAKNSYEITPGLIGLRPQTKVLPEIANLTIAQPSCEYIALAQVGGTPVIWLDKGDGTGRLSELNSSGIVFVLNVTSGTPLRPAFATWQNKLYMFTGETDPGWVIDTSLNATRIGWTDPKVRPNVAEFYYDQLAIAGFDSAAPSRIRWGEATGPETLVVATGDLDVAPNDYDKIVGLKTVVVQGGSAFFEPYLMVFKNRSTHLVRGVPPTTAKIGAGTATAMYPTPYLPKEGLVAKETIADSPLGVIWCSGKNVWLAPPNGNAIELGANIKKLLTSLSFKSPVWNAVYHNGFYKLTVPITTQSLDAIPFPDSSSTVLTPSEQWWCDLRYGPENATWWGPMTFPCAAQHVWVQDDGSEQILHAFAAYNGTTTTIRVPGANEVTSGHVDAHTGFGLALYAPEQNLRTKEYDFGDPMVKKIFDACEIHAWASRSDALAATMYGDGASSSVQPDDTTLGGLGFILGTGVLPAVLSQEFQSLPVYPPNGSRFVAKTFQLSLRTQSTEAILTVNSVGQEVQFRGLGIRVRAITRRPG